MNPAPHQENIKELHIFVDASADAINAVSYLVCKKITGEKTSNIMVAKSHLANPKHQLNIPRLDLMSNVLGATLLAKIQKELPFLISESIIWTDSQVALHWITGDKNFPVFIRNRVNK